jgi:hypothetical protein
MVWEGNIDCLLADREFVGDKWMEFFKTKLGIRYYIKVRNNFKIYSYQAEIKAFLAL